jgi:hypothetical protein
VVLVSEEYKPDSVGWRMEQQEIQGCERVRFGVKRRERFGSLPVN